MNRVILRLTILFSASLVVGTSQAQDRVGDFTLLDQLGYSHNMQWYNDHQSVALLVQANGNEATRMALPDYIDLQKQYAERGIKFFMINPMGRLNRDAVNQEVSQFTSNIPVLMDDTQQISKSLGIDKTGEVFLFDPSAFKVVFRGPVGVEFESAIIAVLNDEAIANSTVAMKGTDVGYVSHGQISYEKDIAPILAENCAACHREGGIAPFAMDSYTMALGWSPMIREVLMTRRMPPGLVDPHINKFVDVPFLEVDEIQKVITWIDAGSPRDGNSDPLAELTWPDSKWTVPYGEPDLIVKIPPQEIPATGILEYRYFNVPIEGMLQDRWVRASEFSPGDRTVVHHGTANVVNPGTTPGEMRRDPDGAQIARFTPGQAPRIEGDNTGGLLKKDSSLYITMHYTTSGKEATDQSEYAIWLHPAGFVPEERLRNSLVGRWDFNWENIPPNVKDFEMSGSQSVEQDINILSLHPHMHFRGKDMRMIADYPDGTREVLINFAAYSYLWQLTYDLEQPKFIPAGTVITTVGHFDNSAQNPYNPDPTVSIPWGEQSWDEMFFGEYLYKTASD